MLTKIISYLNNYDRFPFYTISILPYSFGDSLEQIMHGYETAKKKNKSLLFITVSIFPKFLKYKIASKFLLKNVYIENKNFTSELTKIIFSFFLNFDFFFQRTYHLYLKIKKTKNYHFPCIGLEDLYLKNKFENIEKFKSYELNFIISNEYEKRSKKILEKIGYKNSSKIVCMHIRDSAFHNDLGRRDFRNPKIENYYKSINYLLDKGYSIFRLGLIANKRFEINNNNFFDLPFLVKPEDIEFLQFYLVKRCEFFIASESGPQYLPWFYKKPTLYTNIFRFFYLTSPNLNCRYTMRKFFNKKENRFFNLEEYINLPYRFHDVKFKDDTFDYIENTSKELLESITEFEKLYFKNEWELSDNQISFNNFLKNRLKEMLDKNQNDPDEYLEKNNNKNLIVKNFLSNQGSATKNMITINSKKNNV